MNYNLVLFTIIFILIFKLYWDEQTENMSDGIDLTSQINQYIDYYATTNLEPMRRLNNFITNYLFNGSGIRVNNLNIAGKLNILGGNPLVVKNKNDGIGLMISEQNIGGSIYLYAPNNSDRLGATPGKLVTFNQSSFTI